MDVRVDLGTLERVPGQRPLVTVAVAAIVATVVYLVIQLVLDGQIDLVETGAFVLVFTGVYVAFLYLGDRLESA